jgi:predicted hydrocarbon binding protein
MGYQLNFKKIQKNVLNLLEQFPHGLTTSEIAENLGVNRITMGKYLEMIQLMGAIKSKKVGPANLWFIPKEVIIIKNYVRESLHPIVDKMIKGEKTPLPTLWDEFQLMLFKVSKIGLEVNGSANYIFFEIGEGIAREVLEKYVKKGDLRSVLKSALPIFSRLKIGELELNSIDKSGASLNLHNCPACTGMPVINAPFCHIEAGLISGIINSKIGDVQIKEIKCTSLRDNLCQFDVKIQS